MGGFFKKEKPPPLPAPVESPDPEDPLRRAVARRKAAADRQDGVAASVLAGARLPQQTTFGDAPPTVLGYRA